MKLSNATLKTYKGRNFEAPNITVEFSRDAFVKMVTREASLADLMASGEFKTSDPEAFKAFMSVFDTFKPGFGIVTP
jgi:alkyl sulfatase BDS1-like metallo-beta-lactamase superfamily hydrolase